MSRVSRNLYGGKLSRLLASADDEDFFVMVWATHALQSGRDKKARQFLVFPQEAVDADKSSMYAVHPWELETMLNEVLITPKLKLQPNRLNWRLDCRQFNAIARINNALRSLENAEDGFTLKRINVLQEMPRLAQRQFEWQRGFLSYAQLYRAAFIYGGELTRDFFSSVNGFPLNDFSLACFALRARFHSVPMVQRGARMDEIGISEKLLNGIVDLISRSHLSARDIAYKIRSGPGHIAYKRSLFREYPCVTFGDKNERVLAPLPDLLILRATAGLFYDVVKGSDKVKNEISDRFEKYCLELLQTMLPTISVTRSYQYRYRKNRIDSPDVLVYRNDEVSLILECKATRMSYEARFSEDPLNDARRGYEEMANGIFQIWRFASHCRRGFISRERLQDDVKGIVLTLDTWLSMANLTRSDVFNRARAIAATRDPDIIEADQIPVIFCPIDDFEQTLRMATETSFFSTVNAAAEEEFRGWQLSDVHKKIGPVPTEVKSYPFTSRIADILPWWSQFGPKLGAPV